ncbi:MAG: UDP-N-acetylmuramate dehydrogenase [Myxococcaceae bacterium]
MKKTGTGYFAPISPVLDHVEGEVRENEPLAPKISVRVGGAAQLFVRPSTLDSIVAVLRFAREEGLNVTVLGGGANTLVGDGGVKGITLKLPADLSPELVEPHGDESLLTFSTGAAIVRLVQQMKTNGLVGAEFLAGIPGSLGGAVRMNAGTKHGECMTIVDAVELASAEGLTWVPQAQIPYVYRHTTLPTGSVLTRVRFKLRKGDLAESQQKMDADLKYRKTTQPLSQPNFGSVFTNPKGDHAGRLIESVDLKGYTEGRAQISTLHANWIVNLGGATARDVVTLMALAQARVKDATGIELVPEVQRVGDFS